jgi:hypothetical protein
VQVDRTKAIGYGEPIILYNANNRAGLQLQSAVSQTRTLLPQALEKAPDIKVDFEKLDVGHAVAVQKEEMVPIGSSATLQINKDTSVSVINTPTVNEPERHMLERFLDFMVLALVRRDTTYRAHIMLLDPVHNTLKIAVQYNMDSYEDRNTSLPLNAGCAGNALQNDSVAFYDQRRSDDVYSRGTAMGIDQGRIWGQLKSIISMPIHDSNRTRLGVLSIDSNKFIEDTRFYDDDFKDAMRLATDVIGNVLEKKL